MSEVLVVAGEASGDRIAGLVASALAREGVRCVGVGGPACRAAGVETFADSAALSAMGLADVAVRAPTLARTLARLALRVRRVPPRAALLVNYTELNQRLGRALRARGTRVLWCVAPQVWAWRSGRLASLRGSSDRMAVILPFEAPLWRAAGHDAVYVGHPSMPAPRLERAGPATVAVLPGSRSGEIARLCETLILAARALLDDGSAAAACVVIAPNLAAAAHATVERLASASRLSIVEADPVAGAAPWLAGVHAALCASGTACLEAALAAAAPVVTYRMDPLGFALARRLVRTPHVALPNVLLGRRAFPEILQHDVTVRGVVAAARALLAERERSLALADELRAILAPPSAAPFGSRVADLLLPWL